MTYEDRRNAWRARAAAAGRAAKAFGWGQVVASLLLAAALVAVSQGLIHGAVILLAALAFVAVLYADRLVASRRRRTERTLAFYEAGLDRLAGGFGAPSFDGAAFLPAGHPYASQLDLTGPRSLFARLCAARTCAGASTLLDWLLRPADGAALSARGAAVDAIRGRLELREAWSVAGSSGVSKAEPTAVEAWALAPPSLPGRWLEWVLRAVIASVAATALGAAMGWWSWWLAAAAICVEALAHTLLQLRCGAVLASAELVLDTLGPTVPLLKLLEREHFDAPGVATITARLREGGLASRSLARLARSLERIELLRHELVAMYGYALLWPAREALAVERWRLRHGRHLAGWLAALGQFEALLSVAGYADEHPDHTFADILPAGPPSIEAEGLGHPLLPPGRGVGNDLRLGAGGPRLLLLSGANMAGKSTWLRSIGLAVAMAQAGLPVRARRLRLTPLALGVSIDGGDSLLDGESRFMAELHRLRTIYSLAAGTTPTLFLLDELLSGTNPQDRIAGAGALLEGLLLRGAIGICSTHDLELTRLAERHGPGACNAHFASELAGGRLLFDYRLRPGVVGRSNALDLMRSVGLDVGATAQHPTPRLASIPPGSGATPAATSTR